MGALACCTARPGDGPDCQPLLPMRKGFSGIIPDNLLLEWDILGRCVPGAELQRLQDLRAAVQDCDGHAACRLQPYSRQPATLLRFLRGRDGNVKQAEKMFRDMLEWRSTFQVDEKVERWREELEEQQTQRAVLARRYGSDVVLCPDKFGIPVRLIRLSVADSAGVARELGKEAVLVDTLAKLEFTHQELRRAMFRHETLIRGQVQIIDVGDYGEHGVPQWSSRMWALLNSGQEFYRVCELNYPETVRKVFLIRTGPVTNSIWRLAQPLVPRRTKQKMKLCGQKAKEWIGELRSELQQDQELPGFLRCDTPEAFGAATPKGGIMPVGAAGPDHGRWSVLEPQAAAPGPAAPAAPAAPKAAARGAGLLLLAVICTLLAFAAMRPMSQTAMEAVEHMTG